jgi:hypothetical protein
MAGLPVIPIIDLDSMAKAEDIADWLDENAIEEVAVEADNGDYEWRWKEGILDLNYVKNRDGEKVKELMYLCAVDEIGKLYGLEKPEGMPSKGSMTAARWRIDPDCKVKEGQDQCSNCQDKSYKRKKPPKRQKRRSAKEDAVPKVRRNPIIFQCATIPGSGEACTCCKASGYAGECSFFGPNKRHKNNALTSNIRARRIKEANTKVKLTWDTLEPLLVDAQTITNSIQHIIREAKKHGKAIRQHTKALSGFWTNENANLRIRDERSADENSSDEDGERSMAGE